MSGTSKIARTTTHPNQHRVRHRPPLGATATPAWAWLHQDDGVNYLPPAEWPPKHYDQPPIDDWTPPEY
jgi:hypothetical protein